MRVELAGIVFAIEGELPEAVAARYRAYLTDAPATLACRVRCDAALQTDVADEGIYPGALVEAAGARYRFFRRDLDARIDLDAGTLEVDAAPGLAVESALRIAVSLLLPRRGGLLLHSSGVIEGGRGYVFSGASGAGKTTTVRLLEPRTPLGDDLVALVPDGEGFRALATPFAGEYGVVAPVSAPLARLYFIEQADEHARIPLDAASARARILRNTLSYARDVDTIGHLQDVADRLARRVPCARVRFLRDAGVARWLD